MTISRPANRLLLLTTTTGYQTTAFLEAAAKLQVDVTLATDRCHVLEDPWRDSALAVRFENPEESARHIAEYAQSNPLHAAVALGDRAAVTASLVAEKLGLLGHPSAAAELCRDKYKSRTRLNQAGVNIPRFRRFPVDGSPENLFAPSSSRLEDISFPCVLKPTGLSASRGVIRANNTAEAVTAFRRIRSLLRSPEVQVLRDPATNHIQVEDYIDGIEVAVEAVMERGRLIVLAVFDKPSVDGGAALQGPFFEETMYVTPSRLSHEKLTSIVKTLAESVKALGLYHGPVHAEMRINDSGVWVLEVAARSIGGLCSRALRFKIPLIEENITLEEILIRLAFGLDLQRVFREQPASGVLMIPIPAEGFYQEAIGAERALQIRGVEEVVITAKPLQKLVPLPEGASYLGFIFARGGTTESVEQSLVAAHRELSFKISAALPII